MHIRFEEKAVLFDAVQKIQGCVDKKNTIPILSNILLTLDDGTQQATLIATNLEIGISTTIPVAIQASGVGSITIPSQKLFEILKELPDAPVGIRVDEDNWIFMTCGNSNFKIAGLPIGEFPDIEHEQPDEMTISIPGDVLKMAIDKILYATSNDESRYALTGVAWDFEDLSKSLKLVATDGHRISVQEFALPDDDLRTNTYIVPKKAMSEIKKLCENSDVTVSLSFGKNLLKASVGNTTMYSRLIDAPFPDYRQIIPTTTLHDIVVNRVGLQSALRRVALLASDTRLVGFSCNSDELELSAVDPNLGESHDSLETQDEQEQALSIVFGLNAKYLAEVLASTNVNTIRFGMTDPLSPVRIFAEENLTNVIMPMRV